MKITDLLTKDSILIGQSFENKTEAIDTAIDLMKNLNNLSDVEEFKKQVFIREDLFSTGVGKGVAIPHGKSNSVTKPGLAAITIPRGLEFDSLNGEPVKLIFLIADPEHDTNIHLQILARLSTMLMDQSFIDELVEAKDKDEFLEIINRTEKQKFKDEGFSEEKNKEISGAKNVVAVTGCPTGIVHTYMAADALEKKAKELGYNIKVETRGSAGARNELTKEDIEKAFGVIVASDTKIPMERFKGKRLVVCKVTDGISNPTRLLEKALSEDTSVFDGNVPHEDENESSGNWIYRHLKEILKK